jgi:uncharacterized damage-inducible protein DinB
MNYYGGKELAAAFRTVRNNTIKIAQDIPEDKYDFRASPDVRSVAEMLAHISLGPSFQVQCHAVERRTTLAGFDFPSFMQRVSTEEKAKRNKAQTVEMLQKSGEEFATWLEGLDENFLAERVEMMPGMTPASKSRFEMILGVKEHEMHQRAQLMLVERMVGIVPHLTREMQARMAAAQAAAASGKN